MTPSPITGATGNQEFLMHLRQALTCGGGCLWLLQ